MLCKYADRARATGSRTSTMNLSVLWVVSHINQSLANERININNAAWLGVRLGELGEQIGAHWVWQVVRCGIDASEARP